MTLYREPIGHVEENRNPKFDAAASRNPLNQVSRTYGHTCTRLPGLRARPDFQRAGDGAVGIVSHLMAGEDAAVT